MKLNSEFYRLPLTFDAEQLTKEVSVFSESDWMPHPNAYKGNASIPLISVDGKANDKFSGPMSTTPQLERCPYIKQVIASFDEVFGRSRLMRLAGGCEVPEHSDINYHWYSRVRIHIPIITFPEVQFYCGNKSVHMAAGEAWIFDSWKMHRVSNLTDNNRIHLVIDTSGSSKFWDLVANSDEPHNNIYRASPKPKHIPYSISSTVQIKTEQFNTPVVMAAGEVDSLCLDLISDASRFTENDPGTLESYIKLLNRFRQDWRSIWAQYGSTEAGWKNYHNLIQLISRNITSIQGVGLNSNKSDAVQVFNARILTSCLNPPITIDEPTKINAGATHTDKSPSRNQPCPCGSGKKYKRCHGM